MKNIIFDKLEEMNYIHRGNPNIPIINKATIFDIIDFANMTCEMTSAKNQSQDSTILAHSASLSLSIGRWPCASIECRMQRAKKLAQFAVMFSDCIYIRNYFADYLGHLAFEKMPDESKLREDFKEDIKLILYLRPVIESKKIVLITPPNYCLHCLAKNTLGLDSEKKIEKAFHSIEKRMENEVEVSISFENNFFTLESHGPEDLLEHGQSYLLSEMTPPNIEKMPRIYNKIKNGNTVKLSKWALKMIRYPEYLASYHRRSIIYELSIAQTLNTNFLTEMPLHVEFLKKLSSSSNSFDRDLNIEKNLDCIVPYLDELSISEILKIRENEEDAFILFKSALSNAVEEYRKNYGRFNENDARTLYSDVLRPKLAKLDTRVKNARRNLIKGSYRKIVAWTGAISFGVYLGFVPKELITAASALGLTTLLANFTENLMNNSDTEENIRENSMYFLWKIKKMSKSN